MAIGGPVKSHMKTTRSLQVHLCGGLNQRPVLGTVNKLEVAAPLSTRVIRIDILSLSPRIVEIGRRREERRKSFDVMEFNERNRGSKGSTFAGKGASRLTNSNSLNSKEKKRNITEEKLKAHQ